MDGLAVESPAGVSSFRNTGNHRSARAKPPNSSTVYITSPARVLPKNGMAATNAETSPAPVNG